MKTSFMNLDLHVEENKKALVSIKITFRTLNKHGNVNF